MNTLPQLLDLLTAHVDALREQGIDRVPFSVPLSIDPSPAAATANAAPTPPPASAPAPRTAPKPEAKSETKPTPPQLVWLALKRLPECNDTLPPEQTRIIIICQQSDLTAPHRDLLGKMLHSIGYPLPEIPPHPLETSADLHGKAQRILCFGPAAHAAISTLKMDLALVRGKWQNSPAGRMIATHAPAYLLNNPTGKKAVWTDLQTLLKDLGLTVPDWTRQKLSGQQK